MGRGQGKGCIACFHLKQLKDSRFTEGLPLIYSSKTPYTSIHINWLPWLSPAQHR